MEHTSENIEAFKKLFGSSTTFIRGSGDKVETVKLEELSGKHVGIYFSAHWCPPCRDFTPKLAEFYKSFNKEHKKLEIVFISSDKDVKAFEEYHAEMPWLALPYSNMEIKKALNKKYKIQGIPTLVIVDEQAKMITDNGRGNVMEDPEGKGFPWKPKTFWETLQGEVQDNKGTKINTEALKENTKALGIYFSAHWCGPCRSFTPNLVSSYSKIKEAGKKIEIIFASSDSDEASFKEYFAEMPWLALPFGDPRKKVLSKLYGVQGIPTLVIVDTASGKTITNGGRACISADPEGKEFPWHPKSLNPLSFANSSSLNEESCLLLILDKTKTEDQERLIKEITPIAEEYFDKWKNEDSQPLVFLYAKSGDIIGKIREYMSLPDTNVLSILSIPDGIKFVSEMTADQVDEKSIRQFILDYLNGNLKSIPIQ